MRKLLVFPFSYRNKTERLLDESFNAHPSRILYIAPHMSKARDFKMRYHRFFPDRALPPTSHTIKTLALALLDRYSDKRIISEVEKYVIILQILKAKKNKERFSDTLPGIALAIAHFIKDVKVSTEDSVSFEDIRKKARGYEWKFDYNLSLLLFAVDVMEEYRRLLEKENLVDMDDIYGEASQYVKNLTFDSVLFEGFSEIPAYQKRFIGEIIQKKTDAIFSFCYDEGVSLDAKELLLEKVFSYIKGLSDWEEKRFETEKKDKKIECYNFASQSEEVRGIARIINSYLVENPDTALNDVMTVFPSMPSYRPVVQRIFGRYKLPCEILPGYSLFRNSSISTLLELFALRASYDWDVLMNILMSPHLHRFDFEKSEKFSVSSRENFARTGFFKENFYYAKGGNISLIRSVLEETDSNPKSLKGWVGDLRFFIERLGWDPGIPEVRFAFDKVLQEMGKNTAFSAEEFMNFLGKALELVEVDEGKGYGVKVSGVQESVGLEKNLCIIGGATEDNIPSAPSLEDVFIPDALKKEMGFTDTALRVARERMDLYRLKSENETVFFTYPSKVEGKNRMKSIFLFGYKDSLMEDEEFIHKGKDIFSFDFSEERFREKFIIDGKMNISVTQLEILKRCPYRFYLQFVEDLKPYRTPEIDETPDLWGTIIHSVMQDIFSGYEGVAIGPDGIKEIEERFRAEVHKGIQQLFERGEISGFYRDVLMLRSEEVCNKFISIIRGHEGSSFLDAEYKISIELPSLILKGKIDRIEKRPDGEINIIDIKTGISAPPSYTENDFFKKCNMQIPLYIWMYSKKFNLKKVNGSIWHFSFKEEEESGKNEKFYRREKMNYLERVEDFLEDTAKKILDSDLSVDNLFNSPAEDKSACFSCQYKGVCPYERS
jgi:hypothetical protein